MSQTEVGTEIIGNHKFVIYPMDIGWVPTFFWGLMKARGECQSIGTCLDPDG